MPHAATRIKNVGRVVAESINPTARIPIDRPRDPSRRRSESQPYSDVTTPSRNGTSVINSLDCWRYHEFVARPNVTVTATHFGKCSRIRRHVTRRVSSDIPSIARHGASAPVPNSLCSDASNTGKPGYTLCGAHSPNE